MKQSIKNQHGNHIDSLKLTKLMVVVCLCQPYIRNVDLDLCGPADYSGPQFTSRVTQCGLAHVHTKFSQNRKSHLSQKRGNFSMCNHHHKGK